MGRLGKALRLARQVGVVDAVRFLFADLEKVYVSRYGYRFVPFTDGGWLYYNGLLEKKTFEFIASRLSMYSWFMDVGAGYGEYLLLAASNNVPAVGYEPNPVMYAVADFNIRLNKYEGLVKLYNKPICSMLKATLRVPIPITRGSILRGVEPVVTYRVDCMVPRKEEFMNGRGLVKIDVEGYEEAVIDLLKKYLAETMYDLVVESTDERIGTIEAATNCYCTEIESWKGWRVKNYYCMC